MMKWLIDNWSLLVIILAFIVVATVHFRKLAGLPSDQQVAKIKEWLLLAVVMAEKEMGAGTGAIKLRYVYSLFVDKFPSVAPVVPFELFSKWVDEVLAQMKNMLETNKDIEQYVRGE